MSVFPAGQLPVLDRMAEASHYNAWLFDRSMPYLGRSVLEVGAGTGTFTAALARECERVVAMEPDPVMFDVLRQRFDATRGVTLLSDDVVVATDQPVSFDSIVCFNVLEHIADDEAALRRSFSLLRPGGFLLLLVPAHPALFGAVDVAVGHERRYRRAELRELLEHVGFQLEVDQYVNPVGALGWFVSSRLVRRENIPLEPLRFYDRLVPVLRKLDRVDLGFGLSVWSVSLRPDGGHANREPRA